MAGFGLGMLDDPVLFGSSKVADDASDISLPALGDLSLGAQDLRPHTSAMLASSAFHDPAFWGPNDGTFGLQPSGLGASDGLDLLSFLSPPSLVSDHETATNSSPSDVGDPLVWSPFEDDRSSLAHKSSPSLTSEPTPQTLGPMSPSAVPEFSDAIFCVATGQYIYDKPAKNAKKNTVAGAKPTGVQSRKKNPLPPVIIDTLDDAVAYKRAKNTLAARRSREERNRKFTELEEKVLSLEDEKQTLLSRLETMSALLKGLGYVGPLP